MDEAEREESYFHVSGSPGAQRYRQHKPIGEKEILHKIDILMPNRVRAEQWEDLDLLLSHLAPIFLVIHICVLVVCVGCQIAGPQRPSSIGSAAIGLLSRTSSAAIRTAATSHDGRSFSGALKIGMYCKPEP